MSDKTWYPGCTTGRLLSCTPILGWMNEDHKLRLSFTNRSYWNISCVRYYSQVNVTFVVFNVINILGHCDTLCGPLCRFIKHLAYGCFLRSDTRCSNFVGNWETVFETSNISLSFLQILRKIAHRWWALLLLLCFFFVCEFVLRVSVTQEGKAERGSIVKDRIHVVKH